MKIKLLVFTIALLNFTACSFIFGSPSGTVKAFLAAAQKGDTEAMNKLFSSKAVQKLGEETIKTNNQHFAEMSQRAHEAGRSYSMNQLNETRTGDTARVSFVYQRGDKTDSTKFVFDLSKENGSWKIDDVGGADKEESETQTLSVEPAPVPTIEEQPPPRRGPSPKLDTSRPISAGVLNGKATSLPQPPYPAAARAVKAAGSVIVQVAVDEKGNVTSAQAMSGHPLLRPAAVTAAYSAKFSPTMLSGKAMKVTGVISYNFVAQ